MNAVGTRERARCVCSQVRRRRVLLLVSTGEVYGRADELPTTETAPVTPALALRRVEGGRRARGRAGRPFAGARRRRRPRVPARGARSRRTVRDRFLDAPDSRARARGGGELRSATFARERDITDVRDVCRAYRLLLDRGRPRRDVQRRLRAQGRPVRDRRPARGAGRVPGRRSSSTPTALRARRAGRRLGRRLEARVPPPAGSPRSRSDQTLADALDYARAVVSEKVAKRMTDKRER